MSSSIIYNEDCMDLMSRYPDKYFELAVVDPPYGIGVETCGGHFKKFGKNKGWDKNIPNKEYFDELFRVSQNQIIWGGNYFNLPPTQCFLIWDKKQPEKVSFAMCEYAWTSFNSKAKVFYNVSNQEKNRFHPTQKPVALYDWIFKNYAKEGDKILDTHLGSGSSRIAAYKAGLDFVGCELDKEYFEAADKRFNEFTTQLTMF